VTSTAQAPGLDPAYQAHEQEALLLVELLRSSRLSLLYAEAGADKTTLLRHGLTPLLSRRAGDGLVPGAVRASGVVVPFPDRRRSSVRSSKRRREIVIYFDDWTDTPLAALREALYGAVTADQADRAKANARLGGILDDLSQRFDSHLIVLLDRFEDLLQAPSDEAAIVQFMNELAEAINQPQLAANFLIALAEEAKPRLAGLRSRIPGFDDSSLKLAPPRDFNRVVAPIRRQEPAAPAVVEALPILTETVIVPGCDPVPAPPGALGSTIRAPAKRKVKRPPIPRVEIKTEDVYAMIESALARIAVRTAPDPVDRDESELFANDRLPAGKRGQLPAMQPSSSRAPSNGKSLQEAIERMERRLSHGREGSQDSES
jgi:hypothetical protein